MSKEAYDMVIVGAGAADCVVASYLAEHTDASIALTEVGDLDRDPFIHVPTFVPSARPGNRRRLLADPLAPP